MARKNKRSQLRKPQRGSSTSQRAARPAGIPPAAAAPVPSDGQAAAAAQPAEPTTTNRLVQRPLPRGRGRQGDSVLPTGDATIPLDRVPYFRSDIRRIAITAGLMFILLIAGSIVLRGLLQA
jgi:hypothetical protein